MTKGEKKDERLEIDGKYKALLETAADAIFTLDLLGRFTFVNPAAERISGYSEEELVGKHFRELLPAKYIPACLNMFQRALRGQPTPPIEIEMIAKDGERVPVELLGRPVKKGRRVVEIIGIARDITERKRAEEVLQKSEENFQRIITSIEDVLYNIDGETREFTYLSPAFEKLLGYTMEDIQQMGGRQAFLSQVIQEGEFAEQENAFEQLLSQGVTDIPDWRAWWRCKDGSLVYLEDRSIPVYDGEHLVGTRGVLRDITERKRAEEALRESEDKYRNLVERANDGIIIIQDTIIRYANPRLAEMWGGTVQEVIGTPFTDHVHPDELPKVVDRYKRRMAGKEVPPIYETVLKRKDGSKLYAELNAGIITYQGKAADLVIVRDITERKQAEEALAYERDLLQTLMDSSPDYIFFKDRESRFIRTNKAHAQLLLGLDNPQEAIGKTDFDIFPKEDAQRFYDEEQHIMQSGKPVVAREWQVPSSTTSEIVWVSEHKMPIANENGEVVCLLGISRDITELKQAEEEIRHRGEELAALYDVSLDVTSHLDLNALLKTTLLRAIELLSANGGGLYLYHPERQELELIVHQGLSKDYTGTRLALGEGLSGKVAQSGEPLLIDDYQRWEGRSPQWEGEAMAGSLGVPLKHGDDLLGVLYIAHAPGNIFQEGDLRLATLFANQAAIAIENARLYEEERERRQEAETLHQAAQALSATLDLQEVFGSILSELHKVVPYDSASVQLLRGDRLEIIGGHGFPNLDELLGISFPLDSDNPNRQVVASRAPFFVEDAPAVYSNFRKKPHAQAGIRAWLGVPLLFGDRLIGMIALDKKVPGFYTEEHAHLALAFAAQAAIAIENARLYEETQKRLAETTVLHKVAEAINATLDLKEIFQRVVEELSRTFDYRLADIYLLEGEGLRLQANVGYDAQTILEAIPLARGVVGRVARTGQPAFIRDVSQDPDYIPSYPDITSEICVPIKSGETVLGVLNVECDECRFLTEDDLLLLHTLSSHIGVAIENAHLYEETQRLAITDGLTGLYNLRYFYETLEKEIQRSERYHRSISLVILDIDDLKAYNDLYGHLAGDDLLMELARLMSKVTRRADTSARYGGDEFAIILPETGTEGAEFLAKRLLEEVREHRFSTQAGQTIGRITISLGVATYPHHADSAKALVDAADKALLRAKQAGKSRLSVCEEELTEVEPR